MNTAIIRPLRRIPSYDLPHPKSGHYYRTNILLSPELARTAKAQGINISRLSQNAVEVALNKRPHHRVLEGYKEFPSRCKKGQRPRRRLMLPFAW